MNDYVEATAKEADVLNEITNMVTLTTGEDVAILKCKVKQIGIVLRFLSYLMKAIGMKDLNDQPDMDLSNPAELMMLIADGSDHIYPVASSLCSLSQAEFENLEVDDAMAVMMAEWELNRGFFLQKVLPMLGQQPTKKSRTSKASTKKKSTRKRKAT